MKNIKIVLFLLSITLQLFGGMPVGIPEKVKKSLEQQVNNAVKQGSTSLSNLFDSISSTAFPDQPIKKGIDQSRLNEWQQLLIFLKPSVTQPKIYQSYFDDMMGMGQFYKDSVEKLKAQGITAANKSQIKQQVSNQLKKLDSYYTFAWRRIASNAAQPGASLPQAWVKRIPKDAKSILPNYEKILDNYENLKKQNDAQASLKILQQLGYDKDDKKIEQFIDSLEKLEYRLNEDGKAAWVPAWVKGKKPPYLQLAKDLKEKLINQYPNAFTDLAFDRFAQTKDISSIIILLTAKALKIAFSNLNQTI